MGQLFQSDPELEQAILGNDLNKLQEVLRLRHHQRDELKCQKEEELHKRSNRGLVAPLPHLKPYLDASSQSFSLSPRLIVGSRLVLQNSNNYGVLNCASGMKDALLVKQIESLRNILVSMRKTMEEFHCIVLSLDKIHRDSRQQVKGGSCHLNMKQLQQQIGIKPSLSIAWIA
ncbi:hypothetical protein JHK82_055613 [Glycine max]|nr:hypothetical protein JHK86_055439 [Glycine max]KAG4918169.1 hypothetical protein JHK85_056450 [Glycine max]KAG5074246.1 hypothetical protein JHK84_055477 [Glycine max]KAG5076918.1 hypothetical protein JHK82_055613 [Glycine max]